MDAPELPLMYAVCHSVAGNFAELLGGIVGLLIGCTRALLLLLSKLTTPTGWKEILYGSGQAGTARSRPRSGSHTSVETTATSILANGREATPPSEISSDPPSSRRPLHYVPSAEKEASTQQEGTITLAKGYISTTANTVTSIPGQVTSTVKEFVNSTTTTLVNAPAQVASKLYDTLVPTAVSNWVAGGSSSSTTGVSADTSTTTTKHRGTAGTSVSGKMGGGSSNKSSTDSSNPGLSAHTAPTVTKPKGTAAASVPAALVGNAAAASKAVSSSEDAVLPPKPVEPSAAAGTAGKAPVTSAPTAMPTKPSANEATAPPSKGVASLSLTSSPASTPASSQAVAAASKQAEDATATGFTSSGTAAKPSRKADASAASSPSINAATSKPAVASHGLSKADSNKSAKMPPHFLANQVQGNNASEVSSAQKGPTPATDGLNGSSAAASTPVYLKPITSPSLAAAVEQAESGADTPKLGPIVHTRKTDELSGSDSKPAGVSAAVSPLKDNGQLSSKDSKDTSVTATATTKLAAGAKKVLPDAVLPISMKTSSTGSSAPVAMTPRAEADKALAVLDKTSVTDAAPLLASDRTSAALAPPSGGDKTASGVAPAKPANKVSAPTVTKDAAAADKAPSYAPGAAYTASKAATQQPKAAETAGPAATKADTPLRASQTSTKAAPDSAKLALTENTEVVVGSGDIKLSSTPILADAPVNYSAAETAAVSRNAGSMESASATVGAIKDSAPSKASLAKEDASPVKAATYKPVAPKADGIPPPFDSSVVQAAPTKALASEKRGKQGMDSSSWDAAPIMSAAPKSATPADKVDDVPPPVDSFVQDSAHERMAAIKALPSEKDGKYGQHSVGQKVKDGMKGQDSTEQTATAGSKAASVNRPNLSPVTSPTAPPALTVTSPKPVSIQSPKLPGSGGYVPPSPTTSNVSDVGSSYTEGTATDEDHMDGNGLGTVPEGEVGGDKKKKKKKGLRRKISNRFKKTFVEPFKSGQKETTTTA